VLGIFSTPSDCKGNPLTPLCFTVPSASDPPSTVCLVSRGTTHLPRYNLSPACPASGLALYRHHATYHDVLQSPQYLTPPASLPLPTRLSRNIQRHPMAPASVAPVPSLGYPTTSWDSVVSPAAPCEIHDTTTSSGLSHYPPTSLPSDPMSPVTHPALPHAFRIPLPTCTRSRPTAARLPQLLCVERTETNREAKRLKGAFDTYHIIYYKKGPCTIYQV